MNTQKSGAGRELRELYTEYLPMVYRIAFTYMKNPHDSEDAAQETFMRLIRQLPRLRYDNQVKAWLITTVSNVCRDMLRKKYRTDADIAEYESLAAPLSEDRGVLDAIMKLDDKYKGIVYMFYYEGYSVDDIAMMLGEKPNTVKTRLRRARLALKDELGDDFA